MGERTSAGMTLLFSLLSIFLSAVNARGGPQHPLPASPHPLISVTAATTENLPQLDAGLVQKFHPNAFLLTNESEKAIVALMTHWTFTDAQGFPRDGQINIDSFLNPRSSPVLLPHARMIVGPGAFLLESLAAAPHVGPTLEEMDGRRLREIIGASNIKVTIDLVIFDDGEIAGPNEMRYDVQIQNRKLAAGQLAKQVRNAIANGYDPKTILNNILETIPSPSDAAAIWSHNYARLLLNGRNLDKGLQHLENLPEPPKFYKGGTK
jgi:hypothetical protein